MYLSTNVGIGTIQPTSSLSIAGGNGVSIGSTYTNGPSAGAGNLIVSGNVGIGTFVGNTGALIVQDGNVGIGTNVPGAFLDFGPGDNYRGRKLARVLALGSGATPAINTDNYDEVDITALATAITSFTSSLSGTPKAGDMIHISITDNGSAESITWGTSFEASGNQALPTTTVISTRLDVLFTYNGATSKWRCLAVS